MKLRRALVVVTWAGLAASITPVGTDAVAITIALTVASGLMMLVGLRSRMASEFTFSGGLLGVSYIRSMLMTDGTDGLAPLTAVLLVGFVTAATAYVDGVPDFEDGFTQAQKRTAAIWVGVAVGLAALLGSLQSVESDAPRLTWALGLAATTSLVVLVGWAGRGAGVQRR